MSSFAEPDAEMDGERVIDRSGDIDQRPPGERTGPEAASVIAFKPPARRIGGPAPSVQHYAVPAPAPQRSQPPHPGLAEMAQRLQNGLDKQYAKGKSQLEALAQKIEAQEKKKPGFMAKAFETHPPTPARMEHMQHEIATILPPKPQYVVDTSEFQEVKARLAALENTRKVDQGKNKGPSLRRASTSQGDSTNPGDTTQSTDDRPTLKRRNDP